MYIDGNLKFGLPTITSATSVVSTNTLNAGAAVRMFSGQNVGVIEAFINVTADASASIKIDFIGDSNANLATTPEIIGSSGIILTNAAGTALGTDGDATIRFVVGNQLRAWQHYGLMVTLGGTNPDIVADADQGYLVLEAQTNLIGARLAVPA